jgi:hypothetical protein
MPPDITPDPADDHLASGPRRNTQFGQQIGPDDTSPPEVAHGQRVARESRMVDDAYAGQRARFVQPLDRRPPAQEASEASEYAAPEPGPPSADAGLPVEDSGVWDASPPEGDKAGR